MALIAAPALCETSFFDIGGIHGTGATSSLSESAGAIVYDDGYRRLAIDVPANLRIVGQTMVEGIPGGPYTVRLYRRSDGGFVKETTSLADGSYEFTDIPDAEYQVVAVDDEAGTDYNDVIAGRVTPVP
jgi:hypothetical protein